MTADTNSENTGQTQEQGSAGKSRGRKTAARKRSATRSTGSKRGRPAAASRAGESRSGSQAQGRGAKRGRSRSSGQSGSSTGSSRSAASRRGGRSSGRSSGSSAGIAARVLSGGRRAASWAAEGASRAIPLASRGLGDQRMVQHLADERPYMLGAIGLGIGAMIGLMLPGTLSSMMRSSGGRSRSR